MLWGVRECRRDISVSKTSRRRLDGVAQTSRGFVGVAERSETCFCSEAVTFDADSGDRRSNKPRTIPSLWGVGPIEVRKAVGVRVVRIAWGESYGSRMAGCFEERASGCNWNLETRGWALADELGLTSSEDVILRLFAGRGEEDVSEGYTFDFPKKWARSLS